MDFAREVLGYELWSTQQVMCQALLDHRKTSIRSCHESGKSFAAAVLAAYWISVHPVGDAFVVTTAPTGRQVKAIVWRYINREHARAGLQGRVNQTEWWIGREMVGFGAKPEEHNPEAFQGLHQLYVLVLIDEACGVPAPLWTAADSLVANEDSRLMAWGNPDDPQTEFAAVSKPGSGWHTMQISAFETPNFTGEAMDERVKRQLVSRVWVEEKRLKWAPGWRWTADGVRCEPADGVSAEDCHPFWKSKVLGEFPEVTEGGLFPASWVEAAQRRSLRPVPPSKDATEAYREAYARIPNELGADVGGGGDESTTCHRQGSWFRIVDAHRSPDTMETCGRLIQMRHRTGATRVKVDYIGIGRGVVDRGVELGEPFVGVNVALPPDVTDPEEHGEFGNLRSQYFWGVRERFRLGDIDIDPQDEELAAQLVALRYRIDSRGKTWIESKQEYRKRAAQIGLATLSPDRADALMLAAAPVGRELGDLGITI